MTDNNKKEERSDDDDDDEEDSSMCPMEGCENKRNLENKKGRCDSCQKWWYEAKRIFFGRERRCVKCQEIFEPETNDTTRDKNGYICENCL